MHEIKDIPKREEHILVVVDHHGFPIKYSLIFFMPQLITMQTRKYRHPQFFAHTLSHVKIDDGLIIHSASIVGIQRHSSPISCQRSHNSRLSATLSK